MKKVLAIAPYTYLPYYSGGQKFIAGFYEHLAKYTELTVISTPQNDASLARGYRLLTGLKSSFSRYYDASLVRKISEEVSRGEYDAIIWEHPYYAWLARKVKKRTGIRTILHTHNIEYQRFRSTGKWWWPILKRYEKRFFEKADLILFISDEDREFAIRDWNTDPAKCVDVPFGIDIAEYPADRRQKAALIREKHGIEAGESILLFNGLLNYKPNLDALKAILERINPLLQANSSFRYKILVCGKGLTPEMRGLEEYRDRHIIYAGFVDDITVYFKAADIFLNPVLSGGGVKTKMVEAIGYGCTVIAMRSGASGIHRDVCGEKLVVAGDKDWQAFSDAVITQSKLERETPAAYYHYYNWDRIAAQVAGVI